MILLTIEGMPVSWKAHAGFGRRSFNPRYKEKEYYQWQIKSQWNQDIILSPLRLEFTFHLPIPSGTSKVRRTQMLNGMVHHIKRPDTSNLVKFCEDCLKGIVMEDDSQVTVLLAEKIYSLTPKTLIKIFPIA